MLTRYSLGLALAATVLPAGAAFCQDPGSRPAGGTMAESADSEDDTVEVDGVRARLVLKRGTSLEGILPKGIVWEKLSVGADFDATEPADPAAGLRLYYVLGMEGSIFFRKSEIAEVKDLGAVTPEEKARIRDNVIGARRKVLEEREERLKEALRKVLGTDRPAENPPAVQVPAPGGAPGNASGTAAAAVASPEAAPPAPAEWVRPSGPMTPEEELKAKAEARRRRGDELLERFPPPNWTEDRLETILWRERVAKMPPDNVEAAFVKEYDVWLEALRRRQKAEKKDQPAPAAPGAPGSVPAPAEPAAPPAR